MTPILSPVILIAVALGFAALLFAVAARVEHWPERRIARWRPAAFALALGVYCTSWTFYGAVGSARRDGWDYLPIYLGPILVFAMAPRFLRSLVAAVQAEGATSISDFIGARFGKSRGVAALVTVTAMLGLIPYVALQLRSVGLAFAQLTGGPVALAMAGTAIVLAVFAILFGTRRYEAAGRNEGLVFATAFESLVKLTALLALAGAAIWWLATAPAANSGIAWRGLGDAFALSGIDSELAVIILLSTAAVICLPRQFYIGVIEARSPDDLIGARWSFIFYLTMFAILILPITFAGAALLPVAVDADRYVLQLPVAAGARGMALVAFLGGFSAATAMVVVESTALATMISNDLIAPLLFRARGLPRTANLGRIMLMIRRAAIVLVIGAAFGWARAVPSDARLAQIGYIAFAAMAQIAPLLVLAVGGRVRDPLAAKAGLTAGLLVWLWTLALPPVLPPGWLGAMAGTPVDPVGLFGWRFAAPLAHGVAWSLGLNLLLVATIAQARTDRVKRGATHSPAAPLANHAELVTFVTRFVGEQTAIEVLGAPRDRPIGRAHARNAERAIARVVGAPSARALMASALAGEQLSHEDVARLLDEGGQSLQFSKRLLAATLEHIEPGVSVVDADQRLAAWNSRYLDLFDYPDGMVAVGAPIADLIRFNAMRGECGLGEVEEHVRRRLDHLRRGTVHSFERIRPDGRVLRTAGGPMPDGGYVMCFTDITAEAEARRALETARAELEERVIDRTAALTRLNGELARATRDKTRFLAAASHDLVQPLHAARLFAAAVGRDTGHRHVASIDQAIASAEQLIRALLDISRLDAGGIVPRCEAFALEPMIADVCEGMRPAAAQKGLALRIGPSSGVVESDPVVLRSILQNLVSNAIRYTEKGGVLVGVRRRDADWRIDVIDTGIGIGADQVEMIFQEFHQVRRGGSGLGLGLAIVERSARLIGAGVTVASRPGVGSRFSLTLRTKNSVAAAPPASVVPAAIAQGLSVLVVDDNAGVRDAMTALLQSLGHHVLVTGDPDEAVELAPTCDTALVDYHLNDDRCDGLIVIQRLRSVAPGLRCALVTANVAESVLRRAAAMNVALLSKPLSPPILAQWFVGDRG